MIDPIVAKVQVTREQASEFRDRVNILSPDATARTTSIFWSELLVFSQLFKFIPEQILSAIDDLETGGKRARTKPPTPFVREPLRGMWHKHYTDAWFMPKIFQDALGGKRLPKFGKILEEELSGDGDRDEKILRIRERFEQAYLQKSQAGRLTGEWIVYLPYREKNYYLCLGNHKDITSIYHKIHACQYEPGFKDVLKWWEEVRGATIAPL
jgi:hypothetical protein